MLTARLIIADRSLRDERGHHFSLTQTITEGGRAVGLDVAWFVNRGFSPSLEPDGVTVCRLFSTSMYDVNSLPAAASPGIRRAGIRGGGLTYWPRRIGASLAYRWAKYRGKRPRAEAEITAEIAAHISLADELLAALSTGQLRPDDHLLFHSADGDLYRAVLHIALTIPRDQLPVIHIATPYDTVTMPNYARGISVERIVRYLGLLRLLGRRVFLYGENTQLAEHLSAAWGEAVAPLEIPPPQASVVPGPAAKRDDSLQVVYLGAAREEKGFLSLPEIVRKCAEAKPRRRVAFTIQCTAQIVGYTKSIEAAIERLAAYEPEFVTLIRAEQPMEDYYALLGEADVVLACYDRDKYRFRGSGVAVEAVAFGNSVIVTPGTSPQAIAAEAGVPASGAKEVAAAILEIADRQSEYAQRAEARRARYLAENAPEKYVRNLLSVPAATVSAKPATAREAALTDEPARPMSADWRALLAAEFAPAGDATEQPASRKLLGRNPALASFGRKIA